MTGQDLLNYLRDLRDQKGVVLSELRVGVVADVEEGKGADLLDVVRISAGKGYIAIDAGIRPAPVAKEEGPKIIAPSAMADAKKVIHKASMAAKAIASGHANLNSPGPRGHEKIIALS